MFAGNARHFWGPQVRAGGVVRWPYLDAPTAPTDERDLAAVAVRALRDDGGDGAEYVVTGPQSLTQAEQIQTEGLQQTPDPREAVAQNEVQLAPDLVPAASQESTSDSDD